MLAIAASTIFVACKKDEVKESNATNIVKDNKNLQRGPYLDIRWKEWGRKKKLCDGGGLCFFKIKTGSDVFEPNEMGVPIMSNNNSDYYVELTVSPSLVFEDSTHALYIDEDITDIFNGETYKISEGVYPINMNIGSLGGYTIPVEIY